MSQMPPPELSIAGLLIDLASNAVAILVGLTGFFGGVAHYIAVLARLPRHSVERATGFGFFVGMAVAVGILLTEVLS
jgi:hypothetical protein